MLLLPASGRVDHAPSRPEGTVKTKIITVIFIGAFGIFLVGAGISFLLHYHSFTETAQAVVLVREEKHVMVRVERIPPPEAHRPFSARLVSLTEQTENLKVGDKMEVFHPPGQPHEFLAAHEFYYVKPVIYAVIGVVLFVGAAVTLLIPSLRKSL